MTVCVAIYNILVLAAIGSPRAVRLGCVSGSSLQMPSRAGQGNHCPAYEELPTHWNIDRVIYLHIGT